MTKFLMLALLVCVFALSANAQSASQHLATAITSNFTVNTGPPPTLTPFGWLAPGFAYETSFQQRLEALHNYMTGTAGQSGVFPITTTVSGVSIRWGVGNVTWSQANVIVISTGRGFLGDNPLARVTGNGSSAYAFLATPVSSGVTNATAEDTGSGGGEVRAFGGRRSGSDWSNGIAVASSQDGFAYAEGGLHGGDAQATSVNGNATALGARFSGDATATSTNGDAYAGPVQPSGFYAGPSGALEGGTAQAFSDAGDATAVGGLPTGAADGGDAYATSLSGNASATGAVGQHGGYAEAEAELTASALGGDSAIGGGAATAISHNDVATAQGGSAWLSGAGGDASAFSYKPTGTLAHPFAIAAGGNAEAGTAGSAWAEAVLGSHATGGHAVSTFDVGSRGGIGRAFSDYGFAHAVAGDGNQPGWAYANCANGDASAEGGNGIGQGGAGFPCNGGSAEAEAPLGQAVAIGGDCQSASLSGVGGCATADGSNSGIDSGCPIDEHGYIAIN